jgi:uncharacterized phage protein gp47/JayE
MSVVIPETEETITLPTFPTTADVLASLQSAIQALNTLITNFNPGSVVETYLEGCALGLGSDANTYPGVTAEGAYQLLAQVQNAAFALTATGSALDLKAADVGVYRKPAVAAAGPYVFSIISPTNQAQVIPAGSLVAAEPADPTAPPIIFSTDSDATIAAGATTSNQITITAVTAGSSGNQLTGAVTTIISAGSNVTGTNPQAVSGGADEEQDDSPNGGLRARVLSAIADASQGTISAIEQAAKSFPGVEDAVLVENTAADGTPQDGVGQLYIDDGTGDLGNTSNANHPIIAEVQAAFTSGLYRAAGTQVNVVGSLLLAVTVSLTAQVNQNYTAQTSPLATVVENIQIAIYNYLLTIGIGKPAFVSEIARYANEVAGVSNVIVTSIMINGANVDLMPTNVQVPRAANTAAISVTTQLVNY